MKNILVIGFLVIAVLASGCTSGPQTAPQEKATPPKPTLTPPSTTAEVWIEDFTFSPPEVVIAKGGTVKWSQRDTYQHTVTGGDFDSGKLNQGQTFSHTFNEAGTYEYWSTTDSSMRGKVIVR